MGAVGLVAYRKLCSSTGMGAALSHKGLRGLFMTVPTARCAFDEERESAWTTGRPLSSYPMVVRVQDYVVDANTTVAE